VPKGERGKKCGSSPGNAAQKGRRQQIFIAHFQFLHGSSSSRREFEDIWGINENMCGKDMCVGFH